MATTPVKGYPYPVGTDRVMDGDNVIQALAEAVDADATQYSRALATGQSVPAQTVSNSVLWNVPSPNGCGLTGSGAALTVTRAGLYVISATVLVQNFQTVGTRNYVLLAAGSATPASQNRTIFGGENNGTATLVAALNAGDTIRCDIYTNAATSIAAAAGTTYLNVARLGRS